MKNALVFAAIILLWFGLLVFSLAMVGCKGTTVTVERIIYKPVPVEQGCEMPELGDLPVPVFTKQDDLRCLDLAGRKKLAERMSRMRVWIEKVRARCGPTSRPASQPVDAGGG